MNRLVHATVLGFSLALPLALPAAAQDASELFETMGMPQILEIMREEGLVYGTEIGSDLFAGEPDAGWVTTVDSIYRLDRMVGRVEADFTRALEGEDLSPMLDFFQSERGQQIVSLEVSARRALLDDAVEEASKQAAAVAMAEETDRFRQVEQFVEANDLIETNVVGALNSNYAFFRGMADGDAFDGQLTEDQILTDVWSQEPEIRQSTTEWVYSFLMMAYAPLTDDDMNAYIAFSQTPEGQALNAALFESFDGLFIDISRALGMAAADEMTAQEL